ncbi:MAG: NYN domain-containing protein [Gammaproteobacteria bacterium]|nr:NYN domain-containing protein [Gammaproteobacteria bacterium]
MLRHRQRSSPTGRNASDIALVADAIDLMKRTLDGVVPVSPDSGFTRLARRLREEGPVVHGSGECRVDRGVPQRLRPLHPRREPHGGRTGGEEGRRGSGHGREVQEGADGQGTQERQWHDRRGRRSRGRIRLPAGTVAKP